MPRTYTQAQLAEPAHQAVARAQANDAGGKPAGRKPGKGKGGDDYERVQARAAELFARDSIRDDGAPLPELLPRPDEPGGQAVQAELAELVAAGKADAMRPQQGGFVATKKGRIVKWLVSADRGKDGTVVPSSTRAAIRQQGRLSNLPFAARVDRRLRAIARSWLGKGGDDPTVQEAFRDAYRADRKRRGWNVPDFSRVSEPDEDDEGDD